MYERKKKKIEWNNNSNDNINILKFNMTHSILM